MGKLRLRGFLILSGGQEVWFLAQGHLTRSESSLFSILHFWQAVSPWPASGSLTCRWPFLLYHQATPRFLAALPCFEFRIYTLVTLACTMVWCKIDRGSEACNLRWIALLLAGRSSGERTWRITLPFLTSPHSWISHRQSERHYPTGIPKN